MPLREGRSRSRNGCITCKIRRVKCDEEKPSCHRCRSAGRKCDSYGPSSTSSPNAMNYKIRDMHIIQHIPQVTRPIQIWMLPSFGRLLTEMECSSLEFFRLQTVSCFGPKAGDFLLRAAYHEPSIGSAAVALGSLHRIFLLDGHDQSGRQRAGFALRQYNSAIHQALNVLQGHFKMALQHAVSGLRILKQQESRYSEGTDSLLPSNIIRYMFNTIESQMLEIDWGVSVPVASVRTAEETPCTLEGLSESFGVLYNQFLKIRAMLSIPENLQEHACEDHKVSIAGKQVDSRYLKVKTDIGEWSATFDRYMKTHPLDGRGGDDHRTSSIRILEMWRLTIGIALKVDWPLSESSFDEYTLDFSIVISLAEKIISLTTPPPSRPHSGVQDCVDEDGKSGSRTPNKETRSSTRPTSTSYISILPKPDKSLPLSCTYSACLGILTLLWFVATSCRDSQTRYHAINLMRRSGRREGIWDSNIYARVAMRVVQMEEHAAGIQEGAEYRPAEVPPSARVSAITSQFSDEREREAKVEYFREGVKLGEETVSW
ncbi:hypothetical protein V1509DRAFT_619585 [Lipomyces kononenkoae]